MFQMVSVNNFIKFYFLVSSYLLQVNELSEEEEEDEKLEHIEELPEEGAGKSDDMPEVVQLKMTENILEPNSVTASTRQYFI